MGVQPKDLIATLPRMHENATFGGSPPTSPPPSLPDPSPSPAPTLPGAQRIPQRDRTATDGTPLASNDPQPESSVRGSPGPEGRKLLKKKKRGGSTTPNVLQLPRSRAETDTLRRDHYVSLDNAAKCADKNCRRRFRFRNRKRNCRMCGEVFCRKCTKFLRKLSPNADPDPLGTFRNVCEKCYNLTLRSGRYRDLKHDFIALREEAKRAVKQKLVVEATPLSAQPRSTLKSERIRGEIDRLVKGYEGQNALKGVIGTPNWQKSKDWVPDSKASECFAPECRKRFRLGLRKINCRVCGQVFCRDCTKQEIILFCLFKESPASWAINGKEGTPTSRPHRFETYPVCNGCCKELEEVLLSQIDGPISPADASTLEQSLQATCMDEIASLQAELANLQQNIEQTLPIYQQLTDTLNIEDSSPKRVEGDHPLRDLAKAQADLSDTFTHMANRSQALKNLSPPSETQERLLRHIMMSMFNFYQEYMFLFKSAQMKLKEMIPIESLAMVQEFLDQQSMERVHVALRQLSFEVLNVEKVFRFQLDFAQSLVEADMAIEKELRPVLEKREESWEKHLKCLAEFVQDGFKNRPFIKLDCKQPRNGSNYKLYVQYLALDRTKYVLSRCVRELDAKTREEAFLETKSCLARAGKHVSIELKTITDSLSPEKK